MECAADGDLIVALELPAELAAHSTEIEERISIQPASAKANISLLNAEAQREREQVLLLVDNPLLPAPEEGPALGVTGADDGTVGGESDLTRVTRR